MAYTVYIPPKFLKLSGGQEMLKLSEGLSGDTLKTILSRLEEECPGIKLRICPREKLDPRIAIYINSRKCQDMSFPIPEGAEIAILS